MQTRGHFKLHPSACTLALGLIWIFAFGSDLVFGAETPPATGLASWYGEAHRGKLMANGHPFDPDKLTAASWFYPLGTEVRVTVRDSATVPRQIRRRSVVVRITDRGPAKRLVREGRIIDLAHGAFGGLADPKIGLVRVEVQAEPGR